MSRRPAPPGAVLYRDPANGMILGVCAGLSDQYGFRLGPLRIVMAVALILFTVPVLLTYVVAGLLLPGKPLTYHGHRDERELWGRRRSQRMGS
jgi:phage shock protein PspC (stress-responsive transcriptional regulator)